MAYQNGSTVSFWNEGFLFEHPIRRKKLSKMKLDEAGVELFAD
jgi:hypothetical protein